MLNKLHEECGVFGLFEPTTKDVAHSVYRALYALQHRGQETAHYVCPVPVQYNYG